MGFAADLKGFVSGFKTGVDIGNSMEDRRLRQKELDDRSADPSRMTPEQREIYERTRPTSLPKTDAGPGGGSTSSGPPDLEASRKAISTIESGSADGNYGAIGPRTKTGDQAYGRYQVMGANVPSWTEKHLGKRMTPTEFLKDPTAQDKVFDGEFGGYLKQYGPEGASRMWFSGSPTGGDNKKDVAGTTVKGYGSRFGKLYASYIGDAPTVAGGTSDAGTKTATAPSGATTSTAAAPLDQERTKGVSTWLTDVASDALKANPGLFVVNPETEQVRTPEQQAEYKRKGWSQTDKSYHLAGNALDLIPINPATGQPDKNYKEGFGKINAAMQTAAAGRGVKNLEWGGNWKGFNDPGHFQLAGTSKDYTPGGATAASGPLPPKRPAAAKTASFGGAIPEPAVGTGAPQPVTVAALDEAVLPAQPTDEEEDPMAQPVTFARSGGAIPAPVQRFATGGKVKAPVKKKAPAKATGIPARPTSNETVTLGSAANADSVDYYDWLDENTRRRAAGLDEVAAPTDFRERPTYVQAMNADPVHPVGAISGSGRLYDSPTSAGGRNTAVYKNAYTRGAVTLADGTVTTDAALKSKWKEAYDEYQNELETNRRNAIARSMGGGGGQVDTSKWPGGQPIPGYSTPQAAWQQYFAVRDSPNPTSFVQKINAQLGYTPGSGGRPGQSGAIPDDVASFHSSGPTEGTTWNSYSRPNQAQGAWGDTAAPTMPRTGPAQTQGGGTGAPQFYAYGTPGPNGQTVTNPGGMWSTEGGGGGGGSAGAGGGGTYSGGSWQALGGAQGRGQTWQEGAEWGTGPVGTPGGYGQARYSSPLVVSDQWNPSTGSSQQVATHPQGTVDYAMPVAGMQQPKRYFAGGGAIPDFFVEGRFIEGGPVHGRPFYAEGGTVEDERRPTPPLPPPRPDRPQAQPQQQQQASAAAPAPAPRPTAAIPPMGAGGSEAQHGEVEAANAARQRLQQRQGTYANGLTQGDIDRARSDPSRYGPYFGSGGGDPATTGSTTPLPPKRPADVSTTGSTTGRKPDPVDPDRMKRDPADPVVTVPEVKTLPADIYAREDPNSLTPSFGGAIPAPGPAEPRPMNIPMVRHDATSPAAQDGVGEALVTPPTDDVIARRRAAAQPQPGAPAGPDQGDPELANRIAMPRRDLDPNGTPRPPRIALPGLPTIKTPVDNKGSMPLSEPGLGGEQPTGLPQGPPRPDKKGLRLDVQPVAPPGMVLVTRPDGVITFVPEEQADRYSGPQKSRAGFAQGGAVPRYADGGGIDQDSVYGAQQSYGAGVQRGELPAPTSPMPGAGPGAIPQPGDPQTTGSVSPTGGMTQPPKPRPDGDSGFYQKPSREEIAALNKTGLDEIQKMVHGQGTDQQEQAGPGPAVGADPRQAVAANAYGSNAMAPTTQVMQEAYKAVDPEGKLSTEELQLKTMQDLHDFWLSQGRPDKARTAAASVLLYGKKVAATSGAMALAAAQDGDVLRAAQWLSKGYAYIPNGESVRFEQDPKDKSKIAYWRIGPDGEVTQEKQVVGQEQIANLATAMANGSGWLAETAGAAAGGRRGGGRSTAASDARNENQAALTGLNEAGAKLEAARSGGDAAAIKQAEADFKTEYRKTLTNPSLAPSAKPIADSYMPDLLAKPEKPEKLSDKEQEAERERVAEEKETADARAKVDAEQDPAKKKALQADLDFVPINRQYDKAVKAINRAVPAREIDKSIPAALKQNRANVRSLVEGVLRANNVSPATAYEFVRAATSPQGGAQLQNGRLTLPGLGQIIINRDIADRMKDFYDTRKEGKFDLPAAAQDVNDDSVED